jgi:hypothetical protein
LVLPPGLLVLLSVLQQELLPEHLQLFLLLQLHYKRSH